MKMPIVQHAESVCKREPPLGFVPFGHRRVGHAPVRGHRLARPHRARFRGGVVTDGKDEIELRLVWSRKLQPASWAEATSRRNGACAEDRARFPPASRSAMMPDPTTVAT